VEKKELLCKAEELMAKLGLPEAIAQATQRETATYDPALTTLYPSISKHRAYGPVLQHVVGILLKSGQIRALV
jgi:hypothetical protein